MKFGNNDVLDVSIFDDKNGRLIARLDTLQDSKVLIENGCGLMFLKDALYDEDLLSFIGNKEEDNLSDYEKYLNGKNSRNETRTIVFGNKSKEIGCKIVAKGMWRNNETLEDTVVTFEIPNARLNEDVLSFESSIYDMSEFDLVIQFYPFNDNGDLFKLHF